MTEPRRLDETEPGGRYLSPDETRWTDANGKDLGPVHPESTDAEPEVDDANGGDVAPDAEPDAEAAADAEPVTDDALPAEIEEEIAAQEANAPADANPGRRNGRRSA